MTFVIFTQNLEVFVCIKSLVKSRGPHLKYVAIILFLSWNLRVIFTSKRKNVSDLLESIIMTVQVVIIKKVHMYIAQGELLVLLWFLHFC
jgi:hypothetical protein